MQLVCGWYAACMWLVCSLYVAGMQLDFVGAYLEMLNVLLLINGQLP
jgi:hypothetical protein